MDLSKAFDFLRVFKTGNILSAYSRTFIMRDSIPQLCCIVYFLF